MTIFGKFVTTLVLIGVVGGVYLFTSKKTIQEEVVQQETAATTTEQKKIPFTELIKQKGSYTCEVSQLVKDVITKGTVYMHGDSIRGTFSVMMQGKTLETNVLVRDGYTYTWMSLMKGLGYKVKNKERTEDINNATETAYTWNADSIGDYSCTDWSADDGMFSIPEGVTFTEVGK